jgi:hypothetical protein
VSERAIFIRQDHYQSSFFCLKSTTMAALWNNNEEYLTAYMQELQEQLDSLQPTRNDDEHRKQ